MRAHSLDINRTAKASVGLRMVALLEAGKGAVALLLGFGVFHLIHKNLDDVAPQLGKVLHGDPGEKLWRLFVELSSHATARTLWALALGALGYAAVRSIEAYGLWRERDWAQWFALWSAALYVPPELYWLLRNPSRFKGAVLAANIMILLFMLTLRVNAVRSAAGRNTNCNATSERGRLRDSRTEG